MITIITMTGSVAIASGGQGGGFARGTNAHFVTESIEHSVRLAIAADPQYLTGLLSAEGQMNGKLVEVRLTTATTNRQFVCEMIERPSRGGTVLKKEVLCR